MQDQKCQLMSKYFQCFQGSVGPGTAWVEDTLKSF